MKCSLLLLQTISAYGLAFTSMSDNSIMSRRDLCKKVASLGTTAVSFVLVSPSSSRAAETVGKDPFCNDATCIGVWDGLLADCPHGQISKSSGAGCASSQDDTPGIFAEPWDYSEAPNNSLDYQDQMRLLIPAIQLVSSRRGDKVIIEKQIDRYLQVVFIDRKTAEESIGEFYFTPNDTTVQFRVATRSQNSAELITKSTKNLERCESIRKELRYLKLPVLRNRKRALFFAESDFDTFGPGSASLGPPAEMSTGELEGRQDVDPKLKIDLMESFPMKSRPSRSW